MGSYSCNISCPRCGNPAHADFRTRSPEEYLSCRFCGYTTWIKVDDEKFVEGQPPPEPERYEHKSAGAFHIKDKTGCGQWGSVGDKDNGPVDWEKIIHEFQEILTDPDVDLEESYLTKWDDENKKIINLIGHPKMQIYDECPEDCSEKCLERYGEKGPEKCPRLRDNVVMVAPKT